MGEASRFGCRNEKTIKIYDNEKSNVSFRNTAGGDQDVSAGQGVPAVSGDERESMSYCVDVIFTGRYLVMIKWTKV